MTEDPSASVETSRRAVLGGLGATVSGFGLGDLFDDSPQIDSGDIVLRQGDRCLLVTPFSGGESVETFYGYDIPNGFASEESGGADRGSGPHYSSHGTTHLQQSSGSILLLYDRPDGLSLVVVHGSVADSSSGGAVTFAFEGLSVSGSRPVKDDFYRNQQTGQIAGSNYDRWDVGGWSQTVDWTWAGGRTDGGAFRGLGSDFSVTIDPAFNEEAALSSQPYDGPVESWELLVPSGNGVDRTRLDITEPGTCDGTLSRPSTPSVNIEFKGCGQAWVVFEDAFEGGFDFPVQTTAGWQDVSLTRTDLQLVPGQFGERPVFKWSGRGKVLAVETPSGDLVRNENNCTDSEDDEDDDDSDDEGGDDRDKDDQGDDEGRGPFGRGPDDEEDDVDDDDGGLLAGDRQSDDGNGRGPPDNAGPLWQRDD